MSDKYLTPEEASKILKVSNQTLVDWANKGKIKYTRTRGGHRRYLLSDIDPPEDKPVRRNVCYCRVSTRSQKKDMETQIEFFRNNYPNHEIISDYGSGINFKRKGFKTILDDAIKGNIREIVVTHQDRLCRFGFELIQGIVQTHSDGKIVVLNQKKTSPQEELVSDLISIITVFSSRLYGLRSHQIRNKIKDAIKNSQDEDIPNEGGEGTDSIDV